MDDNNTDSNGSGSVAKKYSLALKGEGMTVDREIDEGTALEILALVMGAGSTITSPGMPTIRPNVPRPLRHASGQSLREYLDEVGATRNPDKILAVAKFHAKETGKEFTQDEVKSRFPDAAERVPGNFTRDFHWAVRNGWIAPSLTSRGEYYVTDTGDEALEEKFSAEIKRKTGVSKARRGGKRRSRKRKTTASE